MDVETDLQLDRLTSSRAADDFAVGNLPKFCLSPDTQRSASVPPSSLANSSDSEGSSNEAKNEQLNFWINLKPIGAIEDNNSVVR